VISPTSQPQQAAMGQTPTTPAAQPTIDPVTGQPIPTPSPVISPITPDVATTPELPSSASSTTDLGVKPVVDNTQPAAQEPEAPASTIT
jgi:hypothetical protein